tara:strand:- start:5973 stop:6344 length:372 start_codon:yes stop_codon:yes gene_type:complete
MNGVNTLNIKYIWVTFRKEGIHQYPDAPEGVEFLKYPHRHIFHFRVELEVFHDDREVEFILFKRELEKLYDQEILQLNNQSCEMIADNLHDYIVKNYPERNHNIEVSEDGENGCRAEYIKEIV